MEVICFDMDNTLVRSTKLHLEAYKKAFAKRKLPKKSDKEILEGFSIETSRAIKALYPKLTKKEIKAIEDDHDQFVIRNAKNYITSIRGAKGTLKAAKKKYKIAILSNCKHKEITATLKAAKIDSKMFDLIIGNDEVKKPKPAPDEIIKAEHLLHIKKGYMVGDSPYDVRAGKKAGLKTIAVCTGTHSRKELVKEKPWKLVKNISEVKKLI